MRLRSIPLLIPCSLFLASFARGESAPTYLLAGPDVSWRVNNTGEAAKNEWAVSNAAFVTKAFASDSAEGGFPIERNKPQYYLGDTLVAPDDVDWEATYSAFNDSDAAVRDNFLFDLEGCRVYVTRGETTNFKWVLTNGETNETVVIASPVSSGRPKNIFWTDAEYGGRPVDLSGKFVKLFGPASILDVKKERRATGETLDDATNYIEVVTSGLYIDDSDDSKLLYAAGRVSGTVVLAYYDSGNYSHIVEVITVQVSRPDTIVRSEFHVGDELKPSGRGYGISGLSASPTTTEDFDGQGPFLYQHTCQYAYSQQNGSVFAIRPSQESTRNQTQIWWYEKDNQGVQWPYEVDEYLVSWADDMPVMVRGDATDDPGRGMTIPSGYVATLMDYQESDIAGTVHASAPDGGSFTTTGAGRSLLKLTKDDNVWFVPVRSVLRGDTDWYRPVTIRRAVGQELSFRRRAFERGAALGKTFDIDLSIPAYVYRGASDPVWNENLYSESGTGSSGCPSVVYPVTAPMDAAITNTVELWWSSSYAQDGMPSALTYPTLPQNFRIVWPDDDETPDIVLASQLGGATVSRWARNGAATFRSCASRIALKSKCYFPDGNGTVAFWTRPQDDDTPRTGVTNEPSCLLQLGTSSGEAVFVRIGKAEQLEVLVNDTTVLSAPLPVKASPDDWLHVSLTVANEKDFTLYFDATNKVASGSLPTAAEFLSQALDRSVVGTPAGTFTNLLEKIIHGNAVSDASSGETSLTDFVDCSTWSEVKSNLLAGRSVRIVADIYHDGTQAYMTHGKAVTLDLNGHTVRRTNDGERMLAIGNGTKLTITGSGVFDGGNYYASWHGSFFDSEGQNSELTIDGDIRIVNFRSQSRSNGGGAICCFTGTTMTFGGNVDISGCRSENRGGAVYNEGVFVMDGGIIQGNTANQGGGVYVTNGGSFMMNGGIISNNTASVEMGGVGLAANAGKLSMSGGAIVYNASQEFPCVGLAGGTAEIQGGIFDVEPTAANFQSRTGASFTEPSYVRLSRLGLYAVCLGTANGRQMAEIKLWSRVLAAEELAAGMYVTPEDGEKNLTGYYSFREDGDGEPFKERISGLACTSTLTSLSTPGVPGEGDCIIQSDTMPTVYRQNDSSCVGYNPNEEHAFVQVGSDGYVAWAFRCDLNQFANVSKPGVLVEYVQDGVAKMQYFDVKVTSARYPVLADRCEVGRALPGPNPFLFFDDPYLPQDYWASDALVPYRDRKGQLWARCAGTFDIHMYYRQQTTFDWPDNVAARKTVAGEAVPWLAYLTGHASDVEPAPAPWTWQVDWPATNSVPTMKIGQTLTTAAGGLPEVWGAASIAVLYPTENVNQTALLCDPTKKRAVPTGIQFNELAALGLTTENNGKLQVYKGSYYFRDVPPSVSDRCYLDVSDMANVRLTLVGRKDDDTVGELHVNVLEAAEKSALENLVTGTDAELLAKWKAAVAELATPAEVPTVTAVGYNASSKRQEFMSTYQAHDHYALTAMGLTNWVVLIENDATNSFCDAGNPISMHIFRIVPEYDLARVVTREDPANLVSQLLSVNYTEHFAGQSDGFEFQWAKAPPGLNGSVPEIGEDQIVGDKSGTTFVIGGQGDTLANMVNTYWTCRYRATTNSPARSVMGDAWSDWCTPYALAEGWVQRVLNNITPFTQRVTDLYENGIDTSVSMIVQAGAPYEGDVALNMDNLSSVGLIQLYRTILSKAESMSLLLGVDDPAANKQLLLAVERLADMYGVLGDEAYTDALNPTIGFGSTLVGMTGAGLDLDYGALSSSLFCFDNQVPTLLDEELALLRGRPCVNLPDNTVGPYYNRLVWNFTKGITAGEVAYAVNYDISGVSENGTMDEETARAQFPQGHGDAYGHYLSALQGYYRLLRNPYFSWEGIVGMGEMNVADNAVNVDYYDEATFAKAAAKVAKTAAKTVELTALKHWRDNGADTVGGGYADANVTNAFGYGEWASRGGYGALCNWAVANDLLPEERSTNGLGVAYADEGLLHIDRGTVGEIAEISSALGEIERMTDRMDAGMNPLGLNDKTVPFDLTPIGGASDATHYEQIRERAQTALANAANVLDNAQTQACRARNVEDAASTVYADQLAIAEQQYKNQLVEIYGKPYDDDIGPGATYPQGYDGPDFYHYMWMDVSSYGFTTPETSCSNEYVAASYMKLDSTIRHEVFSVTNDFDDTVLTVSYELTSDGIVDKPSNITGSRRRCGSLQVAYADFMAAYTDLKCRIEKFKRSEDRMLMELGLIHTLNGIRVTTLKTAEDYYSAGKTASHGKGKAYSKMEELRAEKISLATFKALIDGMASTIDALGAKGVKGTVALSLSGVVDGFDVICAGLEGAIADCEKVLTEAEMAIALAELEYETVAETAYVAEGVISAADEQVAILAEINQAVSALKLAQQQVLLLLTQGENLRDELRLVRQQAAKNISKMRYLDMFFRTATSEALSQYDASFALARTYAFLAAKTYGYETGSPLESTEEGCELLRQIVGARMIGELAADGSPMVTANGDAGLSGILAKLDANWANRKTQLGIGNPQQYATWFSLRHELFRLYDGELGDAAWAVELDKYRVADIRTDARFRRYCQPFASQFGLADREPGLIIPFSTSIDYACNLFGKPLAAGDSQLDSTYFATKIAAAGVWFEGFDERREGYQGQSAFARTPNVYLVPIGTDRMRVPGSDGEVADFDIIDQTVPVPYPLTAAEIAQANWLPSYLDGEFGGVDAETRLRRHPSFRAYYGNRGSSPDDSQLDATRLVGRSVWNTQWLLIVPAGTLNADREKALDAFIHGQKSGTGDTVDILPVKDIRIGFKTYSAGGL